MYITNPGTTKSAPVPPAKSDRFGPHGMRATEVDGHVVQMRLAVARSERTMDASSPGRCDPGDDYNQKNVRLVSPAGRDERNGSMS